MSDIVLIVRNVGKKFCKSLKKSMLYGAKDLVKSAMGISLGDNGLRQDEFWALDDISFELKRGETFGLMGPNGSGKTTMLKMLNGIFMPDKGSIEINGKVGALIELGAGFHPMLTGRENIYVNGVILGMNKKEIDKKFDAIVDFADIGDFLDSPVKNYSSGMFARLGFAIAVHREPDLLIIDEVLAVGDRNFQIKCFNKIYNLKKSGISTILVSHNEYTMREYTQHCVVLNKGKMLFNGKSEDAISFYINKVMQSKDVKLPLQATQGSNKYIIKQVIFKDGEGQVIDRIMTGDKMTIDFDYETSNEIKSPIFGITFLNHEGIVAGFWNSYENIKLNNIRGKGTVRVVIDPLDLPVDTYRYDLIVAQEEEANVLEWRNMEQKFMVERPNGTYGRLKLRQKWEIIKGDS